MADSADFTLLFKTIADQTGLTAMGQGIQRLNSQISEAGRVANEALSFIGLGLGIEKLNEFGNKALEVREQIAVFAQQIQGGIGGSPKLVEDLNRFNEELAKSLAILPETSRSIEQLFSRAGVPFENLERLTKGVIEFAASSAGTVQPLELASILARRLSGAADEGALGLGRFGLKAHDLAGIIGELETRGGNARETFVLASGGAEQCRVAVSEAQVSVGGFVNLIRIPFMLGFTNGLQAAKEKLDGVNQSVDGLGQKTFLAVTIAGDSITGLFSRGSLLFQEFVAMGQATGGEIAQFVLGAVSAVVGAVGTLVTNAITGIDHLALHAADLARDLSHGVVDIKFDIGGDDADKAKFKSLTDSAQAELKKLSDAAGQTAEDARNKVDQIVDQIASDKTPPLIGALFGDQATLDDLKKQYANFVNYLSASKVSPGSRTVSLGGGGDGSGANAEKAATDALTNAKYLLSAAQQTYEAEVEKTKALEDAGDISVSQADARRGAAARDYLAQLEQVKAILPDVIDKLASAGDAKGLAEAKLEWIEIDKLIAKTQIDLGNTTVFGKIHSQLTQLQNDWTDIGKQVGGFLTQQFNQFATTAGNLISNLAFRTGNWRQSILQLAQSFVSSLATMVIQWVLARTVISTLNKIFGQGDTQAANAQAEAAASAWAPAATAASIASYGVAAGLGVAAFLAAIGVGTAGAAAAAGIGGAFAEGGVVPGAPSHRDNTLAWVASGEGILTTATVQRHGGPSFVHALNSGAFFASPHFENGGIVGGAPAGVAQSPGGGNGFQPNIFIHQISSGEHSARLIAQNPEAMHIILDALKGVSYMLPVR